MVMSSQMAGYVDSFIFTTTQNFYHSFFKLILLCAWEHPVLVVTCLKWIAIKADDPTTKVDLIVTCLPKNPNYKYNLRLSTELSGTGTAVD